MTEKDQYSLLIISPVKKEFDDAINLIKKFKDKSFIYVSLNRTEEKIRKLLEENKIDTKNIFFIDCFSSEKEDHKICVDPSDLDMLYSAINSFMDSIKGEKIIIVDEISALVVYNSENEVAKFVKKLVENVTKKRTKLIAFTPKTNNPELLNKVFHFFDKVMD